MLPYGTVICCYAFIYKKINDCFRPFLFYTLKKSGIDKLTEGSTVCAFGTGAISKRTHFSKLLCLVFMCAYFVLCL